MKVNELRIGNFIAYEPTIDDWEEIYVKPGTIIQCEISPDSFEPIPLTEKWLRDFGFSRHHEDYSINTIYIKNVVNNNEFEWGVYPNELGSGIQIKNRIRLKYVHQLQNLHFALTGEELIIF